MSRHIVVPDRETEKKKIIERAKGNSKTVWQAGSRLLLSSEMGRAMLSKACNVSYATLFIACSAWSGPPKIGSILINKMAVMGISLGQTFAWKRILDQLSLI
jgi:hypothetical protein